MSDIVERLRQIDEKEPGRGYGECADEIDSLRQRVAVLEANTETTKRMNAAAMEQLAACEKERDEYSNIIDNQIRAIQELQLKLAASQHYAQQLREALELWKESTLNHRYPHEQTVMMATEAALSLPHDTSALDAYVAEKVAVVEKERNAFQDQCIRRKRELAASQHYAQQLREALKTSLKFSYHKNTCTYSSREESQCTCGLHDHLDSVKEIAANHDTSALDALHSRIAELEVVIKSHGIPVKTASGGVAHYCAGMVERFDAAMEEKE